MKLMKLILLLLVNSVCGRRLKAFSDDDNDGTFNLFSGDGDENLGK